MGQGNEQNCSTVAGSRSATFLGAERRWAEKESTLVRRFAKSVSRLWIVLFCLAGIGGKVLMFSVVLCLLASGWGASRRQAWGMPCREGTKPRRATVCGAKWFAVERKAKGVVSETVRSLVNERIVRALWAFVRSIRMRARKKVGAFCEKLGIFSSKCSTFL